MTTQDPTDVVAASTARFFDLTVEIHDAAVAIHNEQLDEDWDIATLSTTLTATVEQLRRKIQSDDDAVLPRSCLKLGQDLGVRLSRVLAVLADSPPTDLRNAWPIAAVEALGDRIQLLRNQYFASSSKQLPTRKLVKLSAPNESEKREEKDALVPVLAASTTEETDGTSSPADLMSTKQVETRPKQKKPIPHGPAADLLEDFILDSLAYKSMHDREEEVAKAHGKTFEWIFEDETDRTLNHQFTTWLTSDKLGPIYWISGKPGSGKSTLMRFLFGHASTMAKLKSWAGGLPVSKAGFFFWTSGSKEQRSQTGLLRYLLHQLLSGNRTMMPKTFPDLWEKLQTLTTKERIKLSLDWEAAELMTAFGSFLDGALDMSKICLFVDGLDEFDGDQEELVRFFRSLGNGVNGKNIKMCLSSRPWAVFESSFQSSVPNLKLQELTYQDMYHYVADKFGSDVQIGKCLKANKPFKAPFFEETVRRADGVFLWSRLTVAKVIKEFNPSLGIDHLHAIIRAQPTELDNLFEKLLFADQDAKGISETSALFQLISARETAAGFVNDETANSLTIWEIAFALDPEDNVLVLSDAAIAKASDDEVQSRVDETLARIDQRFMGLLGIFPQRREGNESYTTNETADRESPASVARRVAKHKVTYIHRTIRDWLMEGDGVRERVISKSPEGFDAHLRLLRAGILILKLPVERPYRHRQLNEGWPQIVICMTHARYAQHDQAQLQWSLVNELDRTIGWYWLPKFGCSSDHWAPSMFGAYETRMQAPRIRDPYLCLTTKFGVANYVGKELKNLVLEDGKARLEPESEEKSDLDEDEEEDEDDDEEEDEQQVEQKDEREPTPLLAYATEYICSRNKSIYPLSSPTFVASLLAAPSRHNPGPNHTYTAFFPRVLTTPWIALLQNLRRAHRRGWIQHLDLDPQGTARWTEIIRLFLDAGADFDAVVAADWGFPETSAIVVLEMLDEAYCDAGLEKLRDRMAAGKVKSVQQI